jgi:FkbM family methyltransferase
MLGYFKNKLLGGIGYLILVLSRRSHIKSYRDHHIYINCLSENSSVIDLGAYKGQFSSQISDSFGCRCYAVEAEPSLYNTITENQTIKKFNYAICKENGPVNLYISCEPEVNSIKKNISDAYGIKGSVITEGVNFEKFLEKSGIQNIDILKVDIEGAEIEMFNSISDNVIRKIKQITVEFHSFIDRSTKRDVALIKKRLKNLGFFYLVFPVPWSRKYDCDVLFINKNKVRFTRSEWAYIFILKHIVLNLSRIREITRERLKQINERIY